MADFDAFSMQLLEEAKRFHERALESSSLELQAASLHSALLLGFCSLEAHVNGIAEEFAERDEIDLFTRGFLLERDVRLQNGKFIMANSLKMNRIEERIEFIIRFFSRKPIDKKESWWSDLKAGLDLRNQLTHPKQIPELSVESVERALSGVVETVNRLYVAVYKTKHPAHTRGMGSKLHF